MLQVSPGTFDQAIRLRLHAGIGQIQLGFCQQRVHRRLFVPGHQAEFHFALQVFPDVRSQTRHAGICDTERLCKCLVDFRQVGGFNFLQRNHEVCHLSGHLLAMVVGWKGHLEGLALARLHTKHGLFKLLQHLTVAHDELEIFCFAALERLAIDLPFEVNCHTVCVGGSGILRTLGKCAPLLAQNVQRLVNRRIGHAGLKTINLGRCQISDFHLGENFKHRVKRHFAFGSTRAFGDSGLSSDTQLGLVRSVGEGFANFVIHHFIVNRVTVALRHNIHRDLARTKPVHLDCTCKTLQASFDLALNRAHG